MGGVRVGGLDEGGGGAEEGESLDETHDGEKRRW
jgi:hypothetical protein